MPYLAQSKRLGRGQWGGGYPGFAHKLGSSPSFLCRSGLCPKRTIGGTLIRRETFSQSSTVVHCGHSNRAVLFLAVTIGCLGIQGCSPTAMMMTSDGGANAYFRLLGSSSALSSYSGRTWATFRPSIKARAALFVRSLASDMTYTPVLIPLGTGGPGDALLPGSSMQLSIHLGSVRTKAADIDNAMKPTACVGSSSWSRARRQNRWFGNSAATAFNLSMPTLFAIRDFDPISSIATSSSVGLRESFSAKFSAFLARAATLSTVSPKVLAFAIASVDNDVACPACARAVPESVTALVALVSASLVNSFSDTIFLSERVSFLSPYGYAANSQSTAMTKHAIPISAHFLSLFLSLDQWDKASKNASNTKKITEAKDRPLWIRRTSSSEFQNGIQLAKYAMIIIGLPAACVMRILRHRKKWAKV
ncbi:hypothetical protein GRAN_4373 [Granulicella sibirica]|uniref:Uncharacterized protein n=1 Tax=Granulicella sibirica TaxID=2479048 RepID=A0A4Q0T0E4_9BACT|nr:hypothetical protein GRAN_4373 [Granulicella sibirica]